MVSSWCASYPAYYNLIWSVPLIYPKCTLIFSFSSKPPSLNAPSPTLITHVLIYPINAVYGNFSSINIEKTAK